MTLEIPRYRPPRRASPLTSSHRGYRLPSCRQLPPLLGALSGRNQDESDLRVTSRTH